MSTSEEFPIKVYIDDLHKVTVHRVGCRNLDRLSGGRPLKGYKTYREAIEKNPGAEDCGCLTGRGEQWKR